MFMHLTNLLSVKTIKELLLKHNAKPLKQLGQNFLTRQLVLDKIVSAAELKKSDTILEVGPGIGTLTQELAKAAKMVIAVEKDRKMAEILEETLKDYKNIEIIEGDALKINPKRYALDSESYKLMANLPYYITSPVIRKFLEAESQPALIVLMVQKEVAQRICSKPPHMSLLAISVQFYAEAKIVSYVSKNCFWPVPKVDSAIIKIVPQKNNRNLSSDDFFRVAKAGFSHPRKQLANNLSQSLKINKKQINEWLLKNNINPAQRAETLSISQWVNLAYSL